MRNKRAWGFTLVELLVVIGIIALLISILLPALARAKEQGNRVVCMSNHRQIITAMLLYATDWKVFPHCNWLGQEGAANVPGWLYDSKKGQGSQTTGALWKYLASAGSTVYSCPFDLKPPYLGPVHKITSYGFNGSVNAFGAQSPKVPFFKPGQFKPDDIVVWELNEYYVGGANIFNDGSNFPPEDITRRHMGAHAPKNNNPTPLDKSIGAMVSTAGGNVQTITVFEYHKESGASGRSRLWNVPKAYSVTGH